MRKYILRLVKGGFWNIVGGVVAKGAIAFSYILIARKLAPSMYGEFSIIQSNMLLLGTFAGFGLGSTAVKLISEAETVKDRYGCAINVVKISFISLAIVCFFNVFVF